MTQHPAAYPAGWCPDGYAPGLLRWFDGQHWTAHTRSAAAPPEQDRDGAGPGDPLHWVAPLGRSGLAIAAGWVAVFAFVVWPLAPVALGLGVWSAVDLHRRGGRGRGRAWFAIVIGGIGTLLLLLLAVSMVSS